MFTNKGAQMMRSEKYSNCQTNVWVEKTDSLVFEFWGVAFLNLNLTLAKPRYRKSFKENSETFLLNFLPHDYDSWSGATRHFIQTFKFGIFLKNRAMQFHFALLLFCFIILRLIDIKNSLKTNILKCFSLYCLLPNKI